jgi:ABC-type antimicrobial peptide transport system permease subunit
MVVRRAATLVALGVGIGLVAAMVASQALGGLLFGVHPLDPFVFAAIPALLAVVSLVASVVPARRASRVDPATALRHD